jgi:hypothetical protein
MVRIDLVRKSSGGMEGKFSEEKDRAACRKARSEAVKLDLKADFKGVNGNLVPVSRFCVGDLSNTRKSSSSISTSGLDNG